METRDPTEFHYLPEKSVTWGGLAVTAVLRTSDKDKIFTALSKERICSILPFIQSFAFIRFFLNF